jgi:alpha-1,2-mannosyltransferase
MGLSDTRDRRGQADMHRLATDMAALRPWLAGNPVALWLAAGGGGLCVHLLLWQVSEPQELFSDFFKANWEAAEYLWEMGLSATWPLTGKGGFSNLPAIAWLFVPFVPLGEELAPWAFTAIGIAALAAAWALLVRIADLDWPLAAGLLFCFLANGPIVNSLREGQTSHIIFLLLVAGLALWQAGRRYWAGVVLGVCAVYKLPLLLLGLYFVFRRQWAIVAGGATAMAVVVLSSLALFGVAGLVGWYSDWVQPFFGSAISAFNVQSINGFLIRLAADATALKDWEPRDPALAHRIARLASSAVLLGGAVWLMWRAAPATGAPQPDRRAVARNRLEYVLVLALALVTSPLSWTHYYVFLLLPWALYMGGKLPLPGDAATRLLMRIGFVLTALPVVVMAPEQPGLIPTLLARTVVSACLFGGLLMLAALARGAWHLPAGGAAPRLAPQAERP